MMNKAQAKEIRDVIFQEANRLAREIADSICDSCDRHEGCQNGQDCYARNLDSNRNTLLDECDFYALDDATTVEMVADKFNDAFGGIQCRCGRVAPSVVNFVNNGFKCNRCSSTVMSITRADKARKIAIELAQANLAWERAKRKAQIATDAAFIEPINTTEYWVERGESYIRFWVLPRIWQEEQDVLDFLFQCGYQIEAFECGCSHDCCGHGFSRGAEVRFGRYHILVVQRITRNV